MKLDFFFNGYALASSIFFVALFVGELKGMEFLIMEHNRFIAGIELLISITALFWFANQMTSSHALKGEVSNDEN